MLSPDWFDHTHHYPGEAVIVSLYDRLRINEKHRIGTIPLCTVRCTVGKYTHGPTRKKEMTNQNHSSVHSFILCCCIATIIFFFFQFVVFYVSHKMHAYYHSFINLLIVLLLAASSSGV